MKRYLLSTVMILLLAVPVLADGVIEQPFAPTPTPTPCPTCIPPDGGEGSQSATQDVDPVMESLISTFLVLINLP
jgi:hypothetical protein